MKLYLLVRDEDVSGVSGTGIVADVFEATDGHVAIRWRANADGDASWSLPDHGIDQVARVHGHGGRTRLVSVTNVVEARVGSSGELDLLVTCRE